MYQPLTFFDGKQLRLLRSSQYPKGTMWQTGTRRQTGWYLA